MSEFKVEICIITVSSHPEADRLEIGQIKGYQVVVGKGLYKTGDLVAYIPEYAVLPSDVIEEMDLVGKLAHSGRNVVKPVKLRGIVSQGLCYPINGNRLAPYNNKYKFQEGLDVTELLGITKYEPAIPVHMAGDVWNAIGKTLHFDVENIKNYPDVLVEGELVNVSTKLHGTCIQVGIYPTSTGHNVNYDVIIASKGIAAKGLAFKLDGETNKDNLYVKTVRRAGLVDFILRYYSNYLKELTPVYVLGEIYGPVQDLKYGLTDPKIAIFDVYIGKPNEGRFLDRTETLTLLEDYFAEYSFNLVDTVKHQEVDYSLDLIEKMAAEDYIDSKGNRYLNEGVVVVANRPDPVLGNRIILKSINPAYLTRKGETSEYN